MHYRILLTCLLLLQVLPFAFGQRTFTNPLKLSGPDPWVIRKDGWYYYMNTTGRDLRLYKTRSMADLAQASHKIIFTPPATGPYARDLWAPEIHYINAKWYVYVAADSASNLSHRIWVLENSSADPMEGSWTMKGKLADPGDHWAIDMSVFEHQKQLYAIWSGWAGAANGQQNIYLARLKNPWTMEGDRVLISQPDQPWEQHGDVPQAWQKNGEVPKIYVNEGPEALQHNGRLFVVYSANACWLDYCLGLLTYSGNGSLLDPAQWTKSPKPVFSQAPENGVYAPGHGGFFQSADGQQDWMIYHANASATDGCGDKRAPYTQPFTWNADGSPNFGIPLPRTPIPVPAGE